MMDAADFIVGVIVALFIGAIIWGLVLTCVWVETSQCSGKTEGLNLPHRWTFWGDCQVYYKNAWVPLENFRVF